MFILEGRSRNIHRNGQREKYVNMRDGHFDIQNNVRGGIILVNR